MLCLPIMVIITIHIYIYIYIYNIDDNKENVYKVNNLLYYLKLNL